MCKPTVCQVEGCKGTNGIYRHRLTGLWACKACRHYYNQSGTFERERRWHSSVLVCEVDGCSNTSEVYLHGPTGMRACAACRTAYRRRKTFERPRRIYMYEQKMCAVCEIRKAVVNSSGGDVKPRCKRCHSFFLRHGRERPRETKYTRERRCTNCKRNTEEYAQKTKLCYLCSSFLKRNGELPSKEHIARYAPHGWCECSKPATQFVPGLQTGVLRVNPTLTGSNDTVSEQTHEYGEWMCDDCAEAEYEMRGMGSNEYRPTGLLMREAAD